RAAALIDLGAGFGREFTGRENIYVNSALNGMTKRQTEERIDDMIAFSELGRFIDTPVKGYSSGMLVRLGFAIAAHIDADVLLIDEVLAVGDEAFQRKCLRAINERIAGGTTLVLVSHAPLAIQRTCERLIVLDAGQIIFDGPTADGLRFYHELMEDAPEPEAEHAIEAVKLLDAAGASRAIFGTGDPMTVALTLGAPGRVELLLHHGDKLIFRTWEDAERAGQVRFDIPHLHLLGGDYELTVTLNGSGPRPVTMAIADSPEAIGIADLRGTWKTAVTT
ncbi:MAG: lipopolysaccharide transport system ATP-binding protein, partial [Solirubrobacteraceae bacterium]|nr:lipopolysaccharide transport system ATP-binding protein [Solirubrobacteraceae bacterium]